MAIAARDIQAARSVGRRTHRPEIIRWLVVEPAKAEKAEGQESRKGGRGRQPTTIAGRLPGPDARPPAGTASNDHSLPVMAGRG
jgi:hypothetical protein